MDPSINPSHTSDPPPDSISPLNLECFSTPPSSLTLKSPPPVVNQTPKQRRAAIRKQIKENIGINTDNRAQKRKSGKMGLNLKKKNCSKKSDVDGSATQNIELEVVLEVNEVLEDGSGNIAMDENVEVHNGKPLDFQPCTIEEAMDIAKNFVNGGSSRVNDVPDSTKGPSNDDLMNNSVTNDSVHGHNTGNVNAFLKESGDFVFGGNSQSKSDPKINVGPKGNIEGTSAVDKSKSQSELVKNAWGNNSENRPSFAEMSH